MDVYDSWEYDCEGYLKSYELKWLSRSGLFGWLSDHCENNKDGCVSDCVDVVRICFLG